MSIQPLADRVVLKALETQNTTASGLYIPDTASKEKPFIYEVVAVWPGKTDSQMTVSVGDKVLCGQYSWDEVKYEGDEFKIVGIDYILAKID